MRPLSFTLFFVVCVVFVPSPVHSLPPIGHLPQLIRITGALLGPGEETGKHYPTLEVRVAGRLQTLYVREV